MRRGVALLALAALSACASTSGIRWAQDGDYALAIQDNPAQQRFDLTLSSKASAPLCLSKESWPNPAALPAGFDGATLATSSGQKELLPTGSAYCPGGCGEVRIEPGQQVQGAIPYSAFGDAAAIAADSTRTLTFQVRPYQCTGK